MAAQDYLNRVQAVVNKLKPQIDYSTIQNAKHSVKLIRNAQKELRAIKKQVNDVMKKIRADYAEQAQKGGGGFSTALRIAGKKKAAGQLNTKVKQQLKQKQEKALEPYEKVKSAIDSSILQLDSVKVQIENLIAQQ